MPTEKLAKAIGEEWKQYLTLLNLRNWDTLDKPVTEQIYVHSKLLIADDRIAILGSANINDRSQWGDRDGEMAVIVTDSKPVSVKLDGAHMDQVAHSVHDLRKRLWRKLFGMESSNRRSATLGNDAILNSPAAPATWKAIQEVASDNARAYERAFWFIPRSGARPEVQTKSPRDTEPGPPPASIWPTWHYKDYLAHDLGGQLQYRMPFDELFWQKAKGDEVKNTWDVPRDKANGNPPVTAPDGVEGFIVALPVNWTARENNNSGMNLTILADTSTLPESGPASTMQRVSAGVAGDAGQDEPHKESMG
jgi:phospholipase D1/2